MRAFWESVAGTKTYALAGAVSLAVLGLVFFGRLSTPIAASIFLILVSGFGVTFRSALARHQADELQLLREIAQAGLAYRIHDEPALRSAVVAVVRDACGLAEKLSDERCTKGAE